jgi:uncharacterized protein (DUF433 family)
MSLELIHDRGSGPEIAGTRISVYTLLPHFLDPTATEGFLCRTYELTPEQLAAARAYVLNHAETVLARHLKIEERMAAGNPPEVAERAEQTRATFRQFQNWLESRSPADSTPATARNGSGHIPTFREWVAERESRPAQGT